MQQWDTVEDIPVLLIDDIYRAIRRFASPDRTFKDSHFIEVKAYKARGYEYSNWTAVPYLLANGVRLARLVREEPNVPSISGGQLHVFFELGDHLGSTSMVLDKETSELVERSTFQAYGGAESDYRPERWKGFREGYRFTGKEDDVEVGLQYFGFRYLNPLLGRWVSADPLTVHRFNADANVYAYVSARALKNTDPLGLCSGIGCDPRRWETQESYDQAKRAHETFMKAARAAEAALVEEDRLALEAHAEGRYTGRSPLEIYGDLSELRDRMDTASATWGEIEMQYQRLLRLCEPVASTFGIGPRHHLHQKQLEEFHTRLRTTIANAGKSGIWSVHVVASIVGRWLGAGEPPSAQFIEKRFHQARRVNELVEQIGQPVLSVKRPGLRSSSAGPAPKVNHSQEVRKPVCVRTRNGADLRRRKAWSNDLARPGSSPDHVRLDK